MFQRHQILELDLAQQQDWFLISGTRWIANGNTIIGTTANLNFPQAGTVDISGTLDRVRITTVNGTDTFDAGSVNIMYEG